MFMIRRTFITVLVGCVVARMVALAGVQGAPQMVLTPAVTSAPDVGAPWLAATVDLMRLGCSEREFFFSGTTAQGPYTSQMIVRQPVDAKRFNGTVITEWLNASSG